MRCQSLTPGNQDARGFAPQLSDHRMKALNCHDAAHIVTEVSEGMITRSSLQLLVLVQQLETESSLTCGEMICIRGCHEARDAE